MLSSDGARWFESRFTGPFRRFGAVPRRAHDADVSIYGGELASGVEGLPATVSGAAWTDEEADAACVGEAVERWQPTPVPSDGIVEACLAEWPLDEPALSPAQCTLFHAEQYGLPEFPYAPFTPATRVRWVCCRDLRSGDPMWAPAELVFLGGSTTTGTRPLSPSISTGLACGRIGDPIALRGLQEVIERDAIVGAWWQRYGLEEHDPDAVFALLPEGTRDRVERPNARYRFLRVDTPFSAHVTMVVSQGEEIEGFCFSAGAACRETRGASWSKALLEAVQGRSYVRHLRTALPAAPGVPTSFAEHALFYSLQPARLADTALAHAADARRDHGCHIAEPIAALRDRLGAQRPILVRHMTPIAVAAASLGWCVLRVCVPSLQPLHGDHRFPLLGGSLWAPRPWREWAAMTPHPFA